MMKFAQHIFYGLFLLILIGVGAIFFAPSIPGMPAIEMKIVQSGSMEPFIKTGGIVFLAPATNYQVGDVITYTETTATIPTTHRIVDSYVERGETWFVTKGDANESIDASPVVASAVLGKVSFTLPFVGFVLDFARQPFGFALLIVLPALLIILGEVDKIIREIRGRRQPTTRCPFVPRFHGMQVVPIGYRRQPVRMMDIAIPARTGFDTRNTLDLSNCIRGSEKAFTEARRRWFPDWALALVLIGSSSVFAVASFVPYTASYFSDSVFSTGNVFRAGIFVVNEPQNFDVLIVIDDEDTSTLTEEEIDPEPEAEIETQLLVEEEIKPEAEIETQLLVEEEEEEATEEEEGDTEPETSDPIENDDAIDDDEEITDDPVEEPEAFEIITDNEEG